MLLILQWFVAYIHSWGKCQISVRSERKWGGNFFKSQLRDPLNFLHGSQVENPDLEEERYRKKSLLCFSPFLPFPRYVLNLLSPFSVPFSCSFYFFSVLVFPYFLLPFSSFASFSFLIFHNPLLSTLSTWSSGAGPWIGLFTANRWSLGKKGNAPWHAAKVWDGCSLLQASPLNHK